MNNLSSKIVCAARHPKTSPSRLKKLSKHRSTTIRLYVASNFNCPASALERLSTDSYRLIVLNVAGHKNTSAKTLQKLASQNDIAIRFEVARNRSALFSILEKLSKDSSKLVRQTAFKNKNNYRLQKLLNFDIIKCFKYKYGKSNGQNRLPQIFYHTMFKNWEHMYFKIIQEI